MSVRQEDTIEKQLIGKTFRHYKGGVYKVIAIAKYTDDPEERLVIYQGVTGTWARSTIEFVGKVYIDSAPMYRFAEVEVVQ